MGEFAYRLVDERGQLKLKAEAMVEKAIREAEQYQKHGGLDGFALCSDYCFIPGLFLRPNLFAELVTPYLAKVTAAYREMGFYVIKHTDGNIMPIIDQLVQSHPHALHSLDPRVGSILQKSKQRYGQQVCLIGNVSCGMLDTGTDDEVAASCVMPYSMACQAEVTFLPPVTASTPGCISHVTNRCSTCGEKKAIIPINQSEIHYPLIDHRK